VLKGATRNSLEEGSLWDPLQAAVLARSLLWRGFSMGCSFLQGTSTCSHVGSSIGCRETTCIAMLFSTGC